ncbi:MAG TPA: glycosyltransferase family 4 protein, partial [Lacipirellulaceae bacterium]|nr:glycosyltransferase family 4 protein [Lacipirellulaceae bacterium]
MRIIVHDFAGHPFEVQLSRALAARGHHVLHLYCESTLTPRGALRRTAADPRTFDINGVGLSETIPKTNFFRRFKLESQYAHKLIGVCEQFQPDVVISANAPSIPQYRLARWCQRRKVRLVSWVQDIYGLAAYRLLSKKLPLIGHAVGQYFIHLDKWSARHSAALVVISDDFRKVFRGWGIDKSRLHVIHNWAPLDEMPQRPRENEWSRAQKLGSNLRFIYAGTLAMKHNPALLLELARTLDQPGRGELIVVSEGPGIEWLTTKAAEQKLRALRCMGFQPFEALPDVLGSADILVAILEADAGVFSVPSKVLSYFCAGRPVLLAVPKQNLAAKIVVESHAGLVVEPTDINGFCSAARRLIDSPQLRDQSGQAARQYAEKNFDIRRIAKEFEA